MTCEVKPTRWLGALRICAATVPMALLLGAPVQGVSDEPELNLDRVWAGCKLGTVTVENLLTNIDASDQGPDVITPNEIAFVVVYSLDNDNDGQPANVKGKDGLTGPVICLNEDLDLDEAPDLGIETTTQTTAIPASGTGATSVTTLDAEDAFILRYRLNGGGTGVDGVIEKVICHSTNDNTDCFRISPLVD